MFCQKFFSFTGWQRLRRTFVVQNVTDPEFPLCKNGRIQGNFTPIVKGITGFDTKGPLLGRVPEVFDAILDRDTKSVWQTNLDLLREHVIGSVETKRVTLIDQSRENGPRSHVHAG